MTLVFYSLHTCIVHIFFDFFSILQRFINEILTVYETHKGCVPVYLRCPDTAFTEYKSKIFDPISIIQNILTHLYKQLFNSNRTYKHAQTKDKTKKINQYVQINNYAAISVSVCIRSDFDCKRKQHIYAMWIYCRKKNKTRK